jgi:hypothetical protein
MVAGAEIAKVNNLTTEVKQTKLRQAFLVIVAAALMFSPTFIARIVYHRLGADISIVAVMSLVLFLVGTFLLLKVLKSRE